MEICSICLEPTENKIIECSHHHCVPCLKEYVKKKTICPICRQPFSIAPYSYKKPKHKPNLNLNIQTKRFLNKFLASRYQLRNCNKVKKTFYSGLMFKYTTTLYLSQYDYNYISPIEIINYDKSRALRLYKYIMSPNCYYNMWIKQNYTDFIEDYLCD
jgi:hypothetical protein